jgi:small acid-soluble spore protein A (major alpha-type SASP)
MAQNTSNRVIVQGAQQQLDQFKYEIASELGLNVQSGYWGDLPARQCGAVGGQMVRRMIQLAEQQLAGGRH